MDWPSFQGWLLPAVLLALAAVVWNARRELKTGQAVLTKKVDEVHKLMQTELRSMDVRIARIESHLWPERPPRRGE